VGRRSRRRNARRDDDARGGAQQRRKPLEEQTEFTVSIKTAGDKEAQRHQRGPGDHQLGLKEAKDLVEAGGVVKEGIAKEEADEIRGKLEAAGATVEVK
jgi:large subunit ribosomal protein L7/L12